MAIRKFKMKANGKKSVVKSKVIVLGETNELETIFITAETKSVLDNNYNKALSELYNEVKIPKTIKILSQYTKDERTLIETVDGIDQNKVITLYDETHPDFISKKSEVENLRTLILLASYFKMDALVETEDGKEITHWEDWGLNPKIGLLGLAKFLADKVNGLGLGEAEIVYISEEIDRVKKGQTTWGEAILLKRESSEELKNNALAELKKVKEKIETEGLDDEDDEGEDADM